MICPQCKERIGQPVVGSMTVEMVRFRETKRAGGVPRRVYGLVRTFLVVLVVHRKLSPVMRSNISMYSSLTFFTSASGSAGMGGSGWWFFLASISSS